MPQIPIIMPQLGESIAEATVISFLANVGRHGRSDQDVIEVETNKATMNVSSPARGKVQSWIAKRDESYAVGACLGQFEVTAEEAERLGLDAPRAAASGSSRGQGKRQHRFTQVARRRTDRARLAGAGARRGRELHVAAHESAHERTRPARRRPGGHRRQRRGGTRDHRGFRKIHRESRQAQTHRSLDHARRGGRRDAPQLDAAAGDRRPAGARLDAVLAHRKSANPKPGPALYALRALALALAENSAPAGRLVGSKIVHPPAIDIGFAVEAEDGVLVPVLRGADKKPLEEFGVALQRTRRTRARTQSSRSKPRAARSRR